MKKLLLLVVIIVIGALGAKKLISEKDKMTQAPTPKMLNYSIKTTQAKEQTLHQKRLFLAQVQSDKEIKIMTKLSGRIKALHVSESQKVKKGDILVEIDDRALLINIKTLEDTLHVQSIDIENSRATLKRSEKLFKANAISKEKLDAIALQLVSKLAQKDATADKINALKVDLDYFRIKAPFNGVVSHIYQHEGDLASFSKAVLSLNSFSKKMQFSFVDSANEIKIKDRVLINNEEIGHVSKIYPNAQNNLSIAEIEVTKRLSLRSKSYISIEVITKSLQGCALPLNTLLHVKNATYVLAYNNNAFEKREVQVEIEDGSSAIISPCINERVALSSESKLSILPFYKNITILGESDEK